MSCSDKIARWNVVGIQGALGSGIFHPIYLTKIIIGEVPQDLHDVVKSDCERAFWGRLQNISGKYCFDHKAISQNQNVLHRPSGGIYIESTGGPVYLASVRAFTVRTRTFFSRSKIVQRM
jgi:hypothetical protein